MTSYSFHKGTTWIIEADFELADGDTLSNVSFAIADADGNVLLTLTSGSGVVINNASTGTATITVLDTQQSDFSPFDRYTYEAKVFTTLGVQEVQGEGAIVVLKSLHAV